MKTLRRILIGSALVAAAAGVASADTIITINATATPASATLTDFGWTLNFAALTAGQLASISGLTLVNTTLSVNASITDSTLNLTNSATTNQEFAFLATTGSVITSNSVSSSDLVGETTAPTTILAVGNVSLPASVPGSRVTYTPGETVDFAPVVVNETLSKLVSGIDYEGGATITGATSSNTTFNGGGGNIHLAQVQNGTISGTLVFDFQEPNTTPEPATLAMMGGALLGLGLFGKRFKKQ